MDFGCLICAEDFNISTRKKINCPSCSFAACRTCCQRYILDQEATVCMNKGKKPDGSYICQKEWSRKFVTDNFSNTWVNNQWKQMNQKVGVEREKALLPATMAVVEQRKEIDQMKEEVKSISYQIDTLTNRRWNLKRQIQDGGSVVTAKVSPHGRACPDSECRGYLSTQWKCGLCDKWTCPECHIIKGTSRDTEHTCNPDTKATAQLLAKDTKPCPKCSIPIYKIDGCDQMWCPECHTAFSWRRGTIETRIHNPHYYHWLRNNNGGTAPRNAGDLECGRDIADHRVMRLFTDICKACPNFALESKTPDFVRAIIRNTIHLNDVQAPRFQTNNVADNLEIRVNYLQGKSDDKKFASHVHTADKAFQKKRDIHDVIHLQVQGITDIIYRMMDVLKPPSFARDNNAKWFTHNLPNIRSKLRDLSHEITSLTEYSNTLLNEHSTTYKCKRYTIHLTTRKLNGDIMY